MSRFLSHSSMLPQAQETRLTSVFFLKTFTTKSQRTNFIIIYKPRRARRSRRKKQRFMQSAIKCKPLGLLINYNEI